MRKLAVLPLLLLAVACNDSTVLQPDDNLEISAANAPRVNATTDCWFSHTSVPWTFRMTPGGVLHQSGGVNVFVCDAGDLLGTQWVTGAGQLNTATGNGTFHGTTGFDVTHYMGQPVTGSFDDCRWHSLLYNYVPPFDDFSQPYKSFECVGSGYFDGWKAKVTAVGGPGVQTQYWEFR